VSVGVVVLAGGVGSRLWPASRASRPKHLLDLVGAPLLRDTIARLPWLTDQVVVVVAEAQLAASRAVLPELRDDQWVVESEPIGTLAAALRGSRAAQADVLVVLPADHFVADVLAFQAALEAAVERAQTGEITLLGVEPDHPSTHFGYIEHDAGRVTAFREKPSEPVAREWIARGALWNAGVFVWTKHVLADALQALNMDAAAPPSGAVDTQLLERLVGVRPLGVVPVSCGWSDLGTWRAVSKHAPSTPVMGEGSPGAWARASKPVVALGLPGVVVVETDDAILVSSQEGLEGLRAAVTELPPEHR